MTRLLLGTLLLALAAPAALAQTPDDGLPPPKPQPQPTEAPPAPAPTPSEAPPATPAPNTEAPAPTAPDGQGRVRFKREQGTAEALKGHLEATLAALRSGDAAALGEKLNAFKPDDEALKEAFTEEGYKALAPKITESAPKLFSGQPAEIAARLGLKPEQSEVEVFMASTEDLLTMESGTDAAREFASGLRRTAQHLKPRFVWYCAVAKGKGPADEPARLQLFFFHKGRFVLLGRIWRIDDE